MNLIARLARKRFLGAALLALGLLTSGATAGITHAGYIVCSTDPTVYLSDGSTVVMSANINTSISNVSAVNYELHVPFGVYATGMQYDQFGYLESVTVIADEPVNFYKEGTTISTLKGVTFTANASISGTCTFPTSSTSGKANQTLWIDFNC